MLNIQNYVRAESLEQAYELNRNRRSHILGGMLWLRQSNITAGTAIDLCGLGLDTIEESDSEYRLGAMVPLRKLELHPGIAALTGGAVEAALKDIVGVQFRNMATVGGSVWGRFGFSDVLTVLLAADCQVELYKAGRLDLETFAQMPYDRDILTHVILKKSTGPIAYRSVRIARTDFPVLTCAAARARPWCCMTSRACWQRASPPSAPGLLRTGPRRRCPPGPTPGAAPNTAPTWCGCWPSACWANWRTRRAEEWRSNCNSTAGW